MNKSFLLLFFKKEALALLVLLLAAGPSRAQDSTLPSWLGDPSGSLRGGYWTRSRSLDGVDDVFTGTVWGRDSIDLGAAGQVGVDGWVGGPSRYGDQDDRDATLRDERYARLRELQWERSFGDLDIHVGRQMFLWGRADGLNPTDNLTPHDYLLLTPEDADQRFGDFAVQADYHVGNYELQLIWQPEFQTSLVPLRPFAGVTYGYAAPSSTLGQYAAKLDHTGGSVDWSVSYYDGYDTLPDVAPAQLLPTGLQIGVANHREQVAGADVSTAVGAYVLRGEAAWAIRHADAADAFFRQRSQLSMVVGGERNFGERLDVSLQLWAQKVIGYRDPGQLSDPILRTVAIYQGVLSNQVDGLEQGATFRVGYNWAHDTWSAETSGVAEFTRGGYLWRGKVSHAITDQWHADVGYDYFNGPQRSQFGYLKHTSTLYGQVRYVF
jgi:hypothetical protein